MDKSLKLIQKCFFIACFVFFANTVFGQQVRNIKSYLASQNINAEIELSGTQVFISVLYRNTTHEIRDRLSEKLPIPEALNYWGKIDELDSYENVRVESVSPTIGNFSQELFFFRKAKVRLANERIIEIRKNILASSSTSQIQKMFSMDLDSFANLYRKKNYDAAIRGFEFLINNYPYKEVSDIKFLIAESYFELKKYPQAVSAYQDVLSNFSLSEEDKNRAIEKLSILYLASANFKKLSDLSNSESQSGVPNTYLSILENKKGDNQKAIDFATKVNSDFRKFESSKFIQGQLDLLLGRVSDAIMHFTYLANLENPLNPVLSEYSKVKLAQIAIGENRFAYADSILLTVVGRDFERYDEVLTTQMWSAHFVKDSQKVIELGEVVLKKYPKSAKTYEILSLLNFHKQLVEWPNRQTEAFDYVFNAFMNLEEAKELNSEYVKLTDIGIDLKASLSEIIENNDFEIMDSLTYQLKNVSLLKEMILKNYLRIFKKYPALNLEIKNDLNQKLITYLETEIVKEERTVKKIAQKNSLVLKESEKKFDDSDAKAKKARQKRDEIYGIYSQIEKDINAEVVRLGKDALAILSDSMEVVRISDNLLVLSNKERTLLSAEQPDPIAQDEIRDLRIQKGFELKSVETSLSQRRSEAKQKEAKIAKLQVKRDEIFESYQSQSTFFAEAEKASVTDLNDYSIALNNQERIEIISEKLNSSSVLNDFESLRMKNDDYLGMSNWGNYAKAKLAGSDFEHYFYNESREDEIVILEQILEELIAPKDGEVLLERMAELEFEMSKIDAVLQDNGIKVPEIEEIRANSKYLDFNSLQQDNLLEVEEPLNQAGEEVIKNEPFENSDTENTEENSEESKNNTEE